MCYGYKLVVSYVIAVFSPGLQLVPSLNGFSQSNSFYLGEIQFIKLFSYMDYAFCGMSKKSLSSLSSRFSSKCSIV